MKSKYLLSFILIACVSLLFAGCASTTSLSTVYMDGSRSYYYQIQVDDEACNNYSIDPNQVIQKIDELAKNLNSQIQLIIAARGLTNQVTFETGVSQSNSYLYEIRWNFSSRQAYLDFYGVTQDDLENQETELIEGTFITKVIVQNSEINNQQDLFLQLNLNVNFDELVQNFADEFFSGDVSKCQEFFSHIQFNIIKCFPNSLNLKSNADATTNAILTESVVGGDNALYTAFLWQCTLAEPTPNILIYYNALTAGNQRAWYLLAIGITAIFGAILFLIFYLNHRKNQKIMGSLNINNNEPIIVDTTATPAPEEKETQNNFEQEQNINKNSSSTNIKIESTNLDTDIQNKSNDKDKKAEETTKNTDNDTKPKN